MDHVLLTAPLLAPLLTAAAAAIVGWRRWIGWLGVAAAATLLAGGALIAVAATTGPPIEGVGGLLRADALSAFMLLVIGAVAVIATWAGIAYVDGELAAGQTTAGGARRYVVLVQMFLAAMVFAVLAHNLGVLWAAVEATTIVTAFLVGHRGTPNSLEAAWKYVVICSVGVALAFLGTVLVYYAALHGGADPDQALDWTYLAAHGDQLDPRVMRVAVGLLVLGFGTKAGLVPMHSWLPDAHSQAPAPVSALMSGVLLSVAFYALLRYRVIAVAAVDPAYVRTLLLVVALLSLALATSMLVAQRDYKRLLAYSSIEHMGLVTLGAAAGTRLAVAAVLLHILGHGLAKAVAFCGSGHILAAEGTAEIAGVRGLLTRRPALAATFGLGLVALLGLPPFSLFASELALARAAVAAGLGWAVAAALLLLLVVFAAVSSHAARMLLGAPPALRRAPPGSVGGATAAPVAPLVVGLLVLAVLGLSIWPLEALLRTASPIVGTG
jgi:hydrogenase-4 component F